LVVLLGVKLRLRPTPRIPNRSTPVVRVSTMSLVERLHRTARRRRQADPTGIAAWCDGLARAVRSGASMAAALREAEPSVAHRDQIADLVLAIDRGASLHDALDVETHDADLGLALTVVRACVEHGGPPAEPLNRVAATLRARGAARAEQRTQSAQARLSAIVMTLLPVVALGVLLLTSASVRAVMTSPVGVGIVVFGGGLNLVGWRWMRWLIAGAAR
jgi:tight adherence protein B